MFSVDDVVVTDYIDCIQCTTSIKKNNAHGFFLRLGKEKKYSLIPNLFTQPTLHTIDDSIVSWKFKDAQADWACFYSVDMTILSKSTIVPLLKKISFDSPNSLEFELHQYPLCKSSKGLCFQRAKMLNFSLNIVRQGAWGQNANISTHHLLALFNEGKRIDIDALRNYHALSCHVIDMPPIMQVKI